MSLLSKIVDRLPRTLQGKSLPSAEVFRRMLSRERYRSERAGSEFAVVTLRLALPGHDRRGLVQVAKLLLPRLRSSDGVGWINATTAGVLLSNTTAQDAWKLVQNFAAELPPGVPRPVYQVWSYPHDWPSLARLTCLPVDSSPLTPRGAGLVEGSSRVERRSRSALGRLASAKNLRRLLERERSRTDRCEGQLSLVTIAVDGAGREAIEQLVDLWKPRLRAADTLGWIERGTLAVVLPNTSAADAWKMLDALQQKLDAHGLKFHSAVHGYPSNWLTSEIPWDAASQELEGGRIVRPLELWFVERMPWWKRSLDVVGAAVGGCCLLPLMAATALAVKYTSPGPVIFAQPRTGRGGRRFTMYKFRTMVTDAEALKQQLMALNEQDGPAFKITHDPRITPLGRFLRKTSIDELPQLWNVLRGEMSLVGPRPLPCVEQDQCHGWYRRRLEVTPGLTCIWQANGGLGVTFHEWMRMDARYAKARTVWHDFQLILRTLGRVVRRKSSR